MDLVKRIAALAAVSAALVLAVAAPAGAITHDVAPPPESTDITHDV